MKVAVLGPGGVGGLLAAALDAGGNEVVVVARGSPPRRTISEQGLRVQSVKLGRASSRVPRALARLEEPVDALIVATKAAGLQAALERIAVAPPLVLPLLNGLDHLGVLRERFDACDGACGRDPRRGRPTAGGGDRAHEPVPARDDGRPRAERGRRRWQALAAALSAAGVPARDL